MGLHELRDWELPEQLLQLTVPGLMERAAVLPILQSSSIVGPGDLSAGLDLTWIDHAALTALYTCN